MVVTDYTELETPYVDTSEVSRRGHRPQDWSRIVYPYTYEMNQALNKDKLDRYRAEADSHRLAMARKGQSSDLTQNAWSHKVHARRALLAGAFRRIAEAISPSEQHSGRIGTTD